MGKAGSILLCMAACLMLDAPALAAPPARSTNAPPAPDNATSVTQGSVVVDGAPIPYHAMAGEIVVHAEGWDDSDRAFPPGEMPKDPAHEDDNKALPAASMSYVAYLKDGADSRRPLTFLFNGGPGSSTVWLHMGAFGPFRVVTSDHTHTPSAPYTMAANQESLLDASDLVFVDAPGTGFGRIAGKDAEKAFWGVDPDAHAFADFIVSFLSRNGRWNSPRFLFGESYGTMRAAVVAGLLQNEREIDLNGVIMLSSVLSNDLGPDQIGNNPGIDLPYALALPSYAATAWYHHRLPGSHPDLTQFLHDVEHFAQNDYLLALEAGAALDPARRDAIAATLHDDTGLPVSYIQRANLRIDGGEFEQNLLADGLDTTGRLDTRFAGPTLDPLAKEAQYDPQSAAISSGYVSAFNDYVRRVLKYGQGQVYRADIEPHDWDFLHAPPGTHEKLQQSTNVMADLASAMIQDPDLHVLLNSGYFDLATPYAEGRYEMQHLPMPARLQDNIEYRYYASGHMVYVNEDSLKALHDNVADFIRRYSKTK